MGELSIEELVALVNELHLEEEVDLLEVERCRTCCSERDGGTC